ncbi:cysteine hydrolase family protein [Bifidobacterium olomucense]|uniref:Amidase n=1 Tax=Bifidobacterium olomucense TaxID=2675324 RepID=A0A7Y0EZP3_9BIFI|nr:isochorismatase family cysteine hydrolase [Bifidobacterium sp. DSM 109959]NMM99353.1 amidase [Bifidobacterium sp. DSM 109959]
MYNTALILIDLQKMYLHQDLRDRYGWPPIWQLDRVLDSCAQLASEARNQGIPVIYTRQIERSDNSDAMPAYRRLKELTQKQFGETLDMASNADASEIIESVAPQPGDIIIEKLRWDAFFNTPLNNILHNLKTERIILAGLQTNVCIETTARSALMQNYEVGIAEDAVSTDGKSLHFAALEALKVLYAEVRPWKQLIDTSAQWNYAITTPNYGRIENDC